MKKTLLLLVLTTIFTTSCTKTLTDFTVLSTKYSSLGNGESEVVKAQQAVKGKSSKMNHILFIPTGSPDMKKAIENALAQSPGAIGLANGKITMKSWSCLFFGKSTYFVEGTPIYDAKGGAGYQHQQTNYNQQYLYDYQNQPSQYQQHSNNSYNFEDNVKNNKKQSDPEEENFYHQVKQGETLKSIADIYEVTIKDIILWNDLKSNAVKPGQKIKIILK